MQEKLKNIFTAKKITATLILAFSLIVSALALAQPVYASGEQMIFTDIDDNEFVVNEDTGWFSIGWDLQSDSFYFVKNPSGSLVFEASDDGLFLNSNVDLIFKNNNEEYLVTRNNTDGYNNYNIKYLGGVLKVYTSDFYNPALTSSDNELKVKLGVSDKRPAISGEENFVTNVDDARPLSFFQAYLSAYDETDGDLTDSIYVVTDNYTANKSVLGSHKVVWGVKDSSDNEATLEAYIRVVDITKPIITGSNAVAKIGYKETWNITNFKSTLTVTDNYSTLTNDDITVKTDGYTTNKTKLGTYNVVFAVKDSSNNEGTFTKPVQVYDNVKPTVSGPTTIATSNTTILTESDVRSQLTASDEIDGNLTNKIVLVEDNYSGKGNKVGNYTIKYSVTDNAGNVGEHTVNIVRSDKLPPVFWIEDNVTIKTTPTTPLTHQQIIDILTATGQVTVNATTTFNFILDEYTGNEEVPGTYAVGLKVRSANGNESVHNMTVKVLETEDGGTTVEPEVPFFESVTFYVLIGIAGLALLVFLVKRKK